MNTTYHIVSRSTQEGLVAAVNLLINNGWKTQGGVAYGGGLWAQAVIHEDGGVAAILKPEYPQLSASDLKALQTQTTKILCEAEGAMTVPEMSKASGVPAFQIISDLMEMNIFADIRQQIDPKVIARFCQNRNLSYLQKNA